MFDGFLYKMENKIKLKKVVFLLMFCFCSLKANSFCKRGWVYHSHTGTCMKIVTQEPGVYFKDAKKTCENIKGGNDGTTNGHLVFIFDEETDNFVKDLVDKEKVPDALIGLHDRVSNGLYHWGDDNEKAVIYFGWKKENLKSNADKNVVVIDKDGWEEVEDNSTPNFICQVDAAYPLPKLTCPLVEVGKDSSKLTCSIETVGQNDLLWTTFGKSGDVSRLNCSNTKCENTTKLTGFPTIKESFLTYSMTIKNVEVTDETRWMCSVKFKGIPDLQQAECDLKVYIMPEEPACSYNFPNRSIVTECISEKAYPQAKCSWEFHLDNNVEVGGKVNNESLKSGKFFKTTCSSEWTVHKSGCYNFSVLMEPDLPGHDISHTPTRQNVNVCIEPPKDPPKFFTTKFVELFSYLNTTENKTVDLTCSVEGGTPPVWRTRIECDKEILTDDATHKGNSVTTELSATRAMDGKFCRCKADFITNEYNDETTITLSVKYPSTVSSFDINGKKGSNNQQVEVADKTQLTFNCSGTGNPTPRLSLDLIDDKKQMVQLETVTSQSLQYEMTASCNTSSQYLCTARNDLNEKGDTQIINLKVQCYPQHCNTSESNPKFGIPVNGKGTVTMCVYAHPQPTNFQLSRKGASVLVSNRYSTVFEYIDERRAKGKITLTVTNLTESELGNYQLYNKYDPSTRTGGYLDFQFVAQGPPECPSDFTAKKVHSQFITLSWTPGFDGGLAQTFTILKAMTQSELDTEMTRKNGINVADSIEGMLEHNITGLSASTAYFLGIDVRNGMGSIKCPRQRLNVSTPALASDASDDQGSFLIIGIIVAIAIILIVIAVIVFFVWRSRRTRRDEKSKDEGDLPDESNEVVGDLYAAVNKSNKKKNKKDEKSKKEGDLPDESNEVVGDVYAAVNKSNKKKNKKDEKSKKEGDLPDESNEVVGDVYAAVNKSNKKKNKKVASDQKKKEENLYSNTGVAIDNSESNVQATGGGQTPREDGIYANETGTAAVKEKSRKKKEKKRKKDQKNAETKELEDQNLGRTVNQDGLVYVTVEINQKTKNPELKSEARKPTYDPVEYVTIQSSKPVEN